MSEQDSHSCQSGIEHLLQFLTEEGEKALLYKKLDSDDAKYLRRGLDAIKEHQSPLKTSLDLIERQFIFLDSHILNLLLAAYDIGKSANMTKTAEAAAEEKKQRQRGGSSGDARRRFASQTWHPDAKRLAEEAWQNSPKEKKASVIRYIRDNWPKAGYLLPLSDKQIDRYISTFSVRKNGH